MASPNLALVPHDEERQPLVNGFSDNGFNVDNNSFPAKTKYRDANQELREAAELKSDLTGDPTMTPFNIAIMVTYVGVILVATVSSREVLKDTKVLSQSLVAAVGVGAVLLYGCLSIFVANNPWGEWDHVCEDTGRVEKVRDFKRNLRRALQQTFETKKVLMYLPSAIFFSLNQTFILMGPIFVGGGLKNMLSQVKIPLSVMGSWLILGKRHNSKQWACIVMLLCGVIMFGIVQKDDLGSSGSSAGEWTKMFLGFVVIFLGSAFAVAGGLLQELYMKREKSTSIFTQKFQTDLSQLVITFLLLFAGPYIGHVLDRGQSSVPMLADAKPENVAMKQDVSTWKATVVNVKDVHWHTHDLYSRELTIFDEFYSRSQIMKEFEMSRKECTDLECCADDKECCEYEALDEDEITSALTEKKFSTCKPSFLKKSSVKRSIEHFADRKKLQAAAGMKVLAKKMEGISKDMVLSPFQPNLRMIAPQEWRDKIAVGGQGLRKPGTTVLEEVDVSNAMQVHESFSKTGTTVELDILDKATGEKLEKKLTPGTKVVQDIRGVYQRVPLARSKGNEGISTAWCAFNTQDMGRKVREEKHEVGEENKLAKKVFFEVKACVVKANDEWRFMVGTNRLEGARAWKVRGTKRGNKETHNPDLSEERVMTLTKLEEAGKFVRLDGKGIEDFLKKFATIADLDCDADKETLNRCLNQPEVVTGSPVLIPRLEEFGGDVKRFSFGREGLQTSGSDDIVYAEEIKYDVEDEAKLKAYSLPLILEVRRGALSPGVEYSGSHNEIKPSHSFVCDNLRCHRDFFKGYPYLLKRAVLTSKKWVGEAGEAAELGYFNANQETTMYQSGLFAGWSLVIFVCVGATMLQYFMNALINKYISVVWNKVCHSAATVISFWVGEMWLNKDPQSDATGVKLLQLIILSVLIFTVVMLFVASKEEGKKEEGKKDNPQVLVEGRKL